jgi:hypothetical protein
MAGKSNYLSAAMLNAVLRNTAYSSPATVYVGLFSTAPTDNSGAGSVEISGGGYARQAATFGAPSVTSGNAGEQVANSATLTFGPATGADWPTAVAFGVFDAVTSGHLLYWAALTVNKTIQQGDSGSFSAGALTVTED